MSKPIPGLDEKRIVRVDLFFTHTPLLSILIPENLSRVRIRIVGSGAFCEVYKKQKRKGEIIIIIIKEKKLASFPPSATISKLTDKMPQKRTKLQNK